jgi:hypothetical protein
MRCRPQSTRVAEARAQPIFIVTNGLRFGTLCNLGEFEQDLGYQISRQTVEVDLRRMLNPVTYQVVVTRADNTSRAGSSRRPYMNNAFRKTPTDQLHCSKSGNVHRRLSLAAPYSVSALHGVTSSTLCRTASRIPRTTR